MPWPKEHKARTRSRIVQAAAAAFRARGIAQVAVDDVMKAAGLTHGGFYAHFRSKDELVREALDEADAQTVAVLGTAGERGPADDPLRAMIDAYLSDAHAAHPEWGCPIAALGPEVARDGAPARRRLGARLTKRLEWMKELLASSTDARAVPIFACMVGGLILARTAGGEKGSAILASCRAFLHDALDRDDRRRTRRGA
jgi:TetR/AcrR family transcriptional repressor of nem operon